jgi:GT2 family glycosyltransferase
MTRVNAASAVITMLPNASLLGVLCLKRYDLLENFIVSALRGTRRPAKILVVDNGGDYSSKMSTRAEVEVIYSGTNIGVACGWNRLLKAGAWIISNDDVELADTTFAELAASLEEGHLFVFGGGWALFGQRPEVADRIGYYDEDFFPAYYEDSDYRMRLKIAGIPIGTPLTKPFLHIQWASSKDSPEELREWIDKNYQHYLRKWGGPPDHETYLTPFNQPELAR